jgi:hypothetical protein
MLLNCADLNKVSAVVVIRWLGCNESASVNFPRQPLSVPSPSRSGWWKVAASLVLVALFIWWFHEAGLPLVPSAEEWATLPAGAWLGNLAAVMLAHTTRCRRWTHLLRPLAPTLNTPHALGVGLLGYFAALAAPLRLGEFVRPLLIARTKAVGFFEALGTIVAERVMDGLTVTLWAAIALQLVTIPDALPDQLGDVPLPVHAAPHVVMIGPVVFGGALGLMSLLWLSRNVVLAAIPRVVGPISRRLAELCTSLVTRLAQGFGTLRQGFRFAFVLDNVLYWGFLVVAHYVLLRGVGFDATFAQAGVLVGLQALGSLLPAGPGQFGAFQLSAYVGLVLFYPTSQVLTDGSMFVFLSYVSQIIAHVLGALLGFWLIRHPATTLTTSP